MVWIALYSLIAMAVATAAFLAGEWMRKPAFPAPDRPGALAAVAGLLWPVLVAGLVELGLIAFIRSRLREPLPVPVARPERVPEPVAR